MLPKKALIAIPSKHFPFYANGMETGLFYTEALHPYLVFEQAGFKVDLVSEDGLFGMDVHSTNEMFLNGEDRAIFDDQEHPFNRKLYHDLKKASDIKAKDYGIIFAAAGHAAIYDYPTAHNLHKTAQEIWTQGGIIAAVCHGPALLPGIIDPKTQRSIIHGQKLQALPHKAKLIYNLLIASVLIKPLSSKKVPL